MGIRARTHTHATWIRREIAMTSKLLLTTAAIVALTIAGCSHDKKMDAPAAPAAEAPAVEAPTVEVPAAEAPAAATEAEAMAKEGDAMAKEGDAMATESAESTEPAAEANPNQAASDACYEKGGSVVQWYDADGEAIEACRTSEGAEYSLADYATYGG